MACSVHSALISPNKPSLIQDTQIRRPTSRSILKPAIRGTVVKVSGHECLGCGILSVNATCHRLQMAACAHFSEQISKHCNVSSSTYIVILGFWVGPDVEDGWGFIEALVNQIC